MTAHDTPRQWLSALMTEEALLPRQIDEAAHLGDAEEARRLSARRKTIKGDILRAQIEVKQLELQMANDARKDAEIRLPALMDRAKRTESEYLAAKEAHEESLRELHGTNHFVGVQQDQANRIQWDIEQLRKRLADVIRAEVGA